VPATNQRFSTFPSVTRTSRARTSTGSNARLPKTAPPTQTTDSRRNSAEPAHQPSPLSPVAAATTTPCAIPAASACAPSAQIHDFRKSP